MIKQALVRTLFHLARLYCRQPWLRRGRYALTDWLCLHQDQLVGLGRRRATIHAGTLPVELDYERFSTVGLYFELHRQFELPLLQEAVALMREPPVSDPVFVDVGANFGLWSVTIGCHVPGARIWAVEPVPAIGDMLRRNVELNQTTFDRLHSRVTLVPAALAANPGRRTFFLSSDSGHGSLVRPSSHATGECPVETLTGDQLLDQIAAPTVHLCKIDVESGEGEVVAGLEASLRTRRIRHLTIEIRRGDTPDTGLQLLDRLRKHGYQLRRGSIDRMQRDGIEEFILSAT